MSMLVPLQAHTNVKDVLAPLFCNGRSFANLIDELSRHFKFESSQNQQGNGHGPYSSYSRHHDADDDAVLEASSESQSTDSEAEGNISDEADDRLVQARVSAQARSTASSTTVAEESYRTTMAKLPDHGSDRPHTEDSEGVRRSRRLGSTTPTARHTTVVHSRTTRRREQTNRSTSPGSGTSAKPSSSQSAALPSTLRPVSHSASGPTYPSTRNTAAAATASSIPQASDLLVNQDAKRGLLGNSAINIPARVLPPRGKGISRGSKVGKSGGGASTDGVSAPSESVSPPRGDITGGIGGSGTSSTTVGGGGSKGIIRGDVLTVMSVTANADGWSEAVGAALATRARAGYVFAQEVDPDSPLSSEFLREEFTEERSGTRKALELRMRLIPASQKVLLCSAWVDSGEYLAAAAKLVAQCQAEVFGIACVRFEQNRSTQGLLDRFNVFAKSMPKGSVPSLNMGMKSCIPASLTKGFHGYTYNRGGRSGGTWVMSGNRMSGIAAPAVVSTSTGGISGSVGEAGRTTTEGRPDRTRKRRRSKGSGTESGPSASPDGSPLLTDAGMDERKGGDPAGPAADEVSAGEGLTDPGDGGEPAEERFGGGGASGRECGGGVVGGGVGSGTLMLLDGALFGEEEGDYAADSERSTDHESIHLGGSTGTGGGRESDEHELSEREMVRRGARRQGSGSAGSVESVGRRTSGRNAMSSGHISPVTDGRASSPEMGMSMDAGNGLSRHGDDGQHGVTRRDGSSTPKRRWVTSDGGRRGVGNSVAPDGGDEAGRLSESTPYGGETTLSRGRSNASHASESALRDGTDTDVDLDDAEHESDISHDAGRREAEELEWRLKHEDQPIFMSRGQTVDDRPLSILPSLSGGGDQGSIGRGSDRSRARGADGLSTLSSRPPQDPEDDHDRNSSYSNDSLGLSRGSGDIGRTIGRRGKGHGRRAGDGDSDGVVDSCAAHDGESVSDHSGRSTVRKAPNVSGGPIPWHHTSVYEANDPTEDRHVELANEGLGVRVYCVCDGHGGSRAAQFVCDNLAKDVMARVEAMAFLVPRQGRDSAVSVSAQDYSGGGGRAGGGRTVSDDETWAGVGDEDIQRSLTQAFASCDERFIAQLDPKKNRGYINAGCCVVLALLIRSRLYVAHVGDCRAVLGTMDAERLYAQFTSSTANASPTAATYNHTDLSGCSAAGQDRVLPSFGSCGKLSAVALSQDHNCDDANEVALVRARSGDENAIRVSRNDEWKGARAIKRVAGSLAVTRAIGDAYLKEAVFSFSPYKEGVPYITSEPAISAIDLTSADQFLVLATDGVWEQVSNEEAVHCVSSSLRHRTDNGAPTGARGAASPGTSRRQRAAAIGSGGGRRGGATSDALVNYVLARSAQGHGMSVPALRALPRGPSRRMLHDDVCATVVHLTHASPAPRSTL